MKSALNKILLLLLITTAILTGCSKDDDVAPIDQLPPATQTGAGTFGCLINGEAFVEIGHPNSLNFNCYYQYVGGGFYFHINAEDQNIQPSYITIEADNTEIQERETYPLGEFTSENTYAAGLFVFDDSEISHSFTSENNSGELKITNMDLENYIISGTFWFDVENPITGETIEIREGRFDTHFGM